MSDPSSSLVKTSSPGSLRRFLSRFKQGDCATASSVESLGTPPVESWVESPAEIKTEDAEVKRQMAMTSINEPLSPVLSTNLISPKKDRRNRVGHNLSQSPESDFGFKILVNGISPNVDIIAVHGLNGHREKTWMASNGTLWLRDLLPFFFDDIRVITYGYDARTHGSRHMTVQYLYDHAITFVSRLVALRRNTKTEQRPIIFVAHSLGGILVKSALIHSTFSTPQHLPDHLSIKLSTYGILFCGTPHAGSGGAAWATAILKIGSIFAKTNTSVITHLKSNSEWLRQQVDQFIGISNNFQMIFCYEGYPTPLALGTSSVIVSRESATIAGSPNTEILGFAKDHKELVRFASVEDEDFQSVVSHLKVWIGNCQEAVTLSWGTQKAAAQYLIEKQSDDQGPRFEVFKLPFRLNIARNPCFIGRKNHLAEIHHHLFPPLGGHSRRVATDGHTVVLYGLGGMGKTQLALNYAAEYANGFSAVFCVDSSSENRARLGFRAIAQRYIDNLTALSDSKERQRALHQYQLDPYVLNNRQLSNDSSHLPAITEAVNGILEQHGNDRWLLILDNMDDIETFPLHDFLPKTPARRVIITTRLTTASRLGYAIEVDGVEEDEGVAILFNSASLRVPTKSDDTFAKAIVQILGCLPLAIEQAGAYISDVQIQLDEYLPLYERHRRDLLKRLPSFDIYNSRRETVYTTWEISYVMLEAKDSAAAELLTLLAFFHHEAIWEGIFELAINDDSTIKLPADFQWLIDLRTNRFAFSTAIGRIMSFSLAKRGMAPPPGTIRLHPLVHSWGRDRLSAAKRERNMILAMFIIGRALETLSKNTSVDEDNSLKRRLILNADACIGFDENDPDSNIFQSLVSEPGYLTAFYFIANLYIEFGRLHQAVDLLKQATSSHEDASQIGLRVQCQSRLAEVLEQLGKLDEAKTLYEDSIAKLTELFGDADDRVLAATNGLGTVLWEMRQTQEARRVLESLISRIRKSSSRLGEVGRKAASTLSIVLGRLGMMEEAVKTQQEVMAEIDADSNIDILTTLEPRYRMAMVLQMAGDWSQAENIFSAVYSERLARLGPETLDTARTANALGRLYYLQGNYVRSRELLDFAWKQQQKLKLDPTHRAQLRVLFNIGVLNRKEGLYDEALEILERTSSIERKIGERDGSYLTCQIELAKLKNDCGQPQEAFAILEKVREIQKTDLLPEQPDYIRATVCMTESLLLLGHVSRAEEILAEVEGVSLGFLTPNHPEELAIHVAKASIRLHQNRGEKSLEDLNDTIGRLESALGKTHRATIMARVLLGQINLQINHAVEGLDQIQKSTTELIECLGSEHPQVRSLVALEAKAIADFQMVDTGKGKIVAS